MPPFKQKKGRFVPGLIGFKGSLSIYYYFLLRLLSASRHSWLILLQSHKYKKWRSCAPSTLCCSQSLKRIGETKWFPSYWLRGCFIRMCPLEKCPLPLQNIKYKKSSNLTSKFSVHCPWMSTMPQKATLSFLILLLCETRPFNRPLWLEGVTDTVTVQLAAM